MTEREEKKELKQDTPVKRIISAPGERPVVSIVGEINKGLLKKALLKFVIKTMQEQAESTPLELLKFDAKQIRKQLHIFGKNPMLPIKVITKLLLKMPRETADWVLESVWWYCPGDDTDCAVHIIRRHARKSPTKASKKPEDPSVIYISPRLLNLPVKEQLRIIAREVAIRLLGLESATADDSDLEHREKMINAILKSWGIKPA